jgi:hypothetical protein
MGRYVIIVLGLKYGGRIAFTLIICRTIPRAVRKTLV